MLTNVQPQPTTYLAQDDPSIAALVYHGIAARIADSRVNRAGNVMERMDHKQALYSGSGRLALAPQEQRLGRDELEDRVEQFAQGNRANVSDEHWAMMRKHNLPISPGEFRAADTRSGELSMPRTFAERHTDKRIDKKGHKKAIQNIYTNRINQINNLTDLRHGHVDGLGSLRPDLQIRERAADKFMGGSKSAPLPRVEAAERLKEKLLGPADLAGTTKVERLAAKLSVSARARKGNLTASEARLQKNRIDAQPGKHGIQAQKRYNKQQRKVDKQARHAANQEYVSRWRDMRRRRAIGRIQTNQRRAEAHRSAIGR